MKYQFISVNHPYDNCSLAPAFIARPAMLSVNWKVAAVRIMSYISWQTKRRNWNSPMGGTFTVYLARRKRVHHLLTLEIYAIHLGITWQLPLLQKPSEYVQLSSVFLFSMADKKGSQKVMPFNVIFTITMYGRVFMRRKHTDISTIRYELSQRGTTLLCDVVSHWLSSYSHWFPRQRYHGRSDITKVGLAHFASAIANWFNKSPNINLHTVEFWNTTTNINLTVYFVKCCSYIYETMIYLLV